MIKKRNTCLTKQTFLRYTIIIITNRTGKIMTEETPFAIIKNTADPDSEPHRKRRAFLAKLRHELRTPLNAVIGYSEMLLEDAEDAENCTDEFITCLEDIHTGGNRMLRIVNEILDATRTVFLTEPHDIEKIGKSLEFRMGGPLETVLACCDTVHRTAGKMEMTDFISDIENIREAVGLLQQQVKNFLMTSDIPETKGNDSRKSCDTASLARNAVDSIRFYHSEALPDTSAGHILLVDDNEMNRAVLSRYLSRKGHKPFVAEDGYRALEMLEKQSFDLILLDIMMPELDGFQVLDRLKKNKEMKDIPVIMISALDEMESVVRCIEMGAEDYLPKPFEPVLLNARIGVCLEKKRLRDREKEFVRQLQAEQEKSEDLLLNILPREIAQRLKQGETNIADSFPDVSVLFMDIVGFTELAGNVTPRQLVEFMNAIFSSFDRLTESHGLEKIKTIGDAYMVVGGLPLPKADHAQSIAEMALDMLDEMEKLNRMMNSSFRIRIGINTGPVVAGVIGIKKFTYDLWGRTVNLASRMESHGIPGSVQMTEQTYRLLADRYCFEKRGPLHIKGEGEMITWLLKGRKN